MNYDDLDHLDSLISEDFISEDEGSVVSNYYSPTNSRALGNKNKLIPPSESFHCFPDEDDLEINPPDSPRITYESDSSQNSEPSRVTKQNSNMIKKVTVSSLKDDLTPFAKSSENENVMRTLKSSSGATLPSTSTILIDSKRADDYSMLENKINDSLLDVLQGRITKTLPKSVENYQGDEKNDDSLKFINIYPSKGVEKTINLLVKGKTCRSKQLLNATEMRIVSRIVNQEIMFGRKSRFYKNVYYDPETDSNVRYEVNRRMLTELNSSPTAMLYVDTKVNPKSLIRNRTMKMGSDESKLARNKIARIRLSRISRPLHPAIKDCKRLKYIKMSERNNEADENENAACSDYDTDDDLDVLDDHDGRELEKRRYGPLEPSKPQFSSLSICPTCNKVYPGYRRMAIHFQKFPNHRDEELLKQLLKNGKGLNDCEPPTSSGRNVCRNSDPSQTNLLNKKTKPNSKLLPQRSRHPAVCIKEVLSRFGAKEIAKYAGPVVAEAMNSWEFLLMRGEKLKSADGSLLISLLKELNVILAQIKAMSSYALEPLTAKNQSCSNRLKIGPENVLQHILGVQPGTYVISDSKPVPGAASVKKQNASLVRVNAEKPKNTVPSTDNTTAKLFDAAVAECLKDESSNIDSNATELNQKIDLNDPNLTVLMFDDISDGQAISADKVPILTTSDSSVSGQLVVPQTQSGNYVANSPLVLDFDMFNETPSSSPQRSRNTRGSESTSLENDSGAQNKPEMSNLALSLPSFTNDMADNSKEPCLGTNDILDFSLLE